MREKKRQDSLNGYLHNFQINECSIKPLCLSASCVMVMEVGVGERQWQDTDSINNPGPVGEREGEFTAHKGGTCC